MDPLWEGRVGVWCLKPIQALALELFSPWPSSQSTTRSKNSQPRGFQESHADDILALVSHFNIVEKDAFQFEAKAAVEIYISNVDVARVDVNLVKLQD